jgi:hypothetical protein
VADQEEEANSSEPEPGAPASGGFGATGWNTWVRRNFSAERFLRPNSSKRQSALATGAAEPVSSPSARSAAVKAAVNNIDARERRLGIFAVIFELALTAVVVIPYLTHKVKPTSDNLKTLSAVHLFAIEGLVLGVFFFLALYFKRRALLGFSSLATGIWLVELPSLRVFGLAYLALGMWLLLRGLKSQQADGRGAARRPASQPRPAKKARAQGSSTADRSAPKPSKRYTPPKPSRRPAPKKRAPAHAEPPN